MPARRAWSLLLALTLGCTAFLFTARSAHATLYPCIGAPVDEPAGGLYPEQRSYLVWQSWWTFDAPGSPQSHDHDEGCWPERETLNAAVTPNVEFWVKHVMHDNPGTANYTSMVFKGTDYETTVQKCYLRQGYDNTCAPAAANGKGDLTCPNPGVCQRWSHFSQPLSLFGHTGLQEIRFRSFIPQPNLGDGVIREIRNNFNGQLYVIGTGKSLANVTREPWVRAKGWYTFPPYGYCEATAVDADPSGPGLVPDAPVSGTWSPVLKQQTHSSDGSLAVSHVFGTLDANFHAVPPVLGTVLWDHDGDLPQQTVPIDTTTLANGLHKLLLRTDCHGTALGGGTNAGVLAIPFVVAN